MSRFRWLLSLVLFLTVVGCSQVQARRSLDCAACEREGQMVFYNCWVTCIGAGVPQQCEDTCKPVECSFYLYNCSPCSFWQERCQ